MALKLIQGKQLDVNLTGSFTGSFTGTLLGTSSFASNAISSSYALTASYLQGYISPFPFTGSALITGSLEVIGSVNITGSLSNGDNNITTGIFSHAEGSGTQAIGDYSHAEGFETDATNVYSHAEGLETLASGTGSHAEGAYSVASGEASHAEGLFTVALGYASHAEGVQTISLGQYSHTEGYFTTSSGQYSHAEGGGTKAIGEGSHAEGVDTIASGGYSHAEGRLTIASGNHSHAEGVSTVAFGDYSHAEGDSTIASGSLSHAEGLFTIALGYVSHAEGAQTIASGSHSHAEGLSTVASGDYSHAEGEGAIALGYASHVEGAATIASGNHSHAEGSLSQAIGNSSHAEGLDTRALGNYQHVQGQYNISSSAQSAFIIGNGTSNANRRNLVFASGSIVQITGSLQVSGSITGSLFGTSSWAVSSSLAQTASYALSSSFSFQAISSSFASNVTSASYATTASYALSNASGVTTNTLYINSLSGSNSTGVLNNPSLPFLNVSGALATLPVDDGTTYHVLFMNYGDHVMPVIPERSLIFEGIAPYGNTADGLLNSELSVKLSFTALGAVNLIATGLGYSERKKFITFKNVVLLSTFTGAQGFSGISSVVEFDNVNIDMRGGGVSSILFGFYSIKGKIDILNTYSTNGYIFSNFNNGVQDLDFHIGKLYLGTGFTGNIFRSVAYMNAHIYYIAGSGSVYLAHSTGTNFRIDLYTFNHTGNVYINTQLFNNRMVTNFNNSEFLNTGVISIGEGYGTFTGCLKDTNTVALTANYERYDAEPRFLNFSGKVYFYKYLHYVPITFINCNLTCNTNLLAYASGSITADAVRFYGTNVIRQTTPSVLIETNTTATTVEKRGILRTNATSLGTNLTFNDTTPNDFIPSSSVFPYTGSALITGSLGVIGPAQISSNLSVTGSINSLSNTSTAGYVYAGSGFSLINGGVGFGDGNMVVRLKPNTTLAAGWETSAHIRETTDQSANYVTSSLPNLKYVTGLISGSSALTASNAVSSSYAQTASYALNAATASNILGGKATHVPFFITDTTLATSSIYQSGSTSIIINQDANTEANPEALYVWQPHPTSINVISGKGNIDNYLQLNIQNTNQGTSGSSDVVATANNGGETDNYIDMGINGENFNGFLGGPNDSYLYSHGHNMWVGNMNDGYDINFFNSSSLEPIIKLTSLGQAQITGSLFGTASWARNSNTSSNSITSSYAIFALNSQNATSASYSLNANSSNNSITASYALQADNANTANYANTAGNGGVTSIIAGSGITLPFGGTGAVTIVAGAGGGGVTIISGSAVTSSFINLDTWVFNHNLNTRTPTITVFDSDYNQIIPQNIQLVSTSSATITFPTLESGFAIASTGGTTGNSFTSSYSLFSTYAASASYYPETDPVFTSKSGSFATTGSNIFKGNQTITGSVYVSSGSSLNLNGVTLFASSSTLFTNANLVPTQHNTQSLGTTTTRWKDIWLGGGSLYIADSIIPGSDLVIEAINDILTVSGSAGLEVGSFKFIDNEIFLADEAIPIIIGSGSATAPVEFYRPLQIISGESGLVTFDASREGRVAIISPNIPAGDIGAFSIIGNSSGSYQPVINPSGMIHVTSNDNQAARITVDGFGSNIGAIYVGRHARGTAATPTPTLSGDILARYAGLGYATSSYFPVVGAVPTSLEFQATENYSTSSYGSRAAFYTYANGAVSRSLSATIDTTGITIPSSSRLFGTASWALNAQTASYYIETDPIFTAKSGSFATTGSNIFIGDQTISGSLKVSGSLTEIGTAVMSGSLTLSSGSTLNLNDGFFVNGHKQFQYASFYHTASQTLTSATTPLPFQFSTIENNSGAFSVALSGSRRSRVTTNTTGWWNVQYSAQVQNSSGFNDYDSYVWIRVNESNVVNSNNIRTIPQSSFDLLASRNTLLYLESGSYFEIMYGAANTAVSFPYTATGVSPTRPATPSISLVVTQHA